MTLMCLLVLLDLSRVGERTISGDVGTSLIVGAEGVGAKSGVPAGSARRFRSGNADSNLRSSSVHAEKIEDQYRIF
jgi:hypothetical protein